MGMGIRSAGTLVRRRLSHLLRSSDPAGARQALSRACTGVVERLEGRTLLTTVPNDPLYDQQWHLSNTSGADIRAQTAWDITQGSNEVVIAVIDSGLDITHPDLAANVFVNPGEIAGNGFDDDENGLIDDVSGWDFVLDSADVTDLNGHGTHVAGIIGAVGNNGVGVSGVAWNVKILPIKIGVDAGRDVSFDAAIDGIHYISQLKRAGVNIVAANASFGGSDFPSDNRFAKAIDELAALDILFVPAAGNDTLDIDANSILPAKFGASESNVITVANTTMFDTLAGSSNFGLQSVQLGAPGTDILSTWSRDADADFDGIGDGTEYNTLSGTSMAAPMVTGTIALMKAANPQATGQQIKQALIKTVDVVEGLDQPYSLSPLVSTSGRLNASRAVRAIDNPFVGSNTATRGNWFGTYAGAGAVVIGDPNASAFPTFVDADLSGVSTRIVDFAPASNKTQAPQLSDLSGRVVGYWETATSMAIPLEFTDSQSHRVSFYALDYENEGRVQSITLIDTDTGAVLDSVTISGFNKGQYLTWDLTGRVTVAVTNLAGSSAVLSAVFFDVAPTAAGSFTGADTTTSGSWKGNFGGEGAFVVGESTAFPSFVSATVSGATQRTVKRSTTKTNALEQVNGTKRTVSYLGSPTDFTIDLTLADDDTHTVTLYAVDYDKKKRVQRMELIDPSTGALLDSRIIENFRGGTYVSWNIDNDDFVTDTARIRIVNAGGPDAVISGIFFDTPTGHHASFAGVDSTTGGTWKGNYGVDGAIIYGDTDPMLDFVDVDPISVQNLTIQTSTFKTNALQKRNAMDDRIVGYIAGNGQMTFDLNFSDHRSHRVSFYAVDFERRKRRQRIELIGTGDDGVVGTADDQVLSSVDLGDFKNGKYVTFDVSEDVRVRVTALSKGSVVLSGIFFD